MRRPQNQAVHTLILDFYCRNTFLPPTPPRLQHFNRTHLDTETGPPQETPSAILSHKLSLNPSRTETVCLVLLLGLAPPQPHRRASPKASAQPVRFRKMGDHRTCQSSHCPRAAGNLGHTQAPRPTLTPPLPANFTLGQGDGGKETQL